MRVIASVDVVVLFGGVPRPSKVGIAEYTYGTGQKTEVFGLCDPYTPERMTHMSYGLDYFDPEDALTWTREKANGWFFFDAGTTCTEVKISTEELEKGLRALGLLGTELDS